MEKIAFLLAFAIFLGIDGALVRHKPDVAQLLTITEPK